MPIPPPELRELLNQKLDSLRQQLTTHVLGAEEPAFLLLSALLAGGHVLIQGAPGIGKTTLGKTLAQLFHGSFQRVQFTPDLLPGDILGYSIYNQAEHSFEFIEGPVFSNLVLADEINRTSPRIQSALLECMNEGQVSIDGVTRPLGKPFLVIATQNSRCSAGTFPLPEPQLDRFLLSIEMSLPDTGTQARILKMHAGSANGVGLSPVVSVEEVIAWQEAVRAVEVSDPVCAYIVSLCEAVRGRRDVKNGVSARGSIALMRTAQAFACLEGRDAAYPDDVKRALIPVLAHRLAPVDEEANVDESTRRRRVTETLRGVLTEVAVP
jgi:MoxR-like ATPase